jgi:serine/threonine protein phosphatase PrpC
MGSKSIRLVPKGGVLGYRISKTHKHILKLYGGETLLLYSDGIKEHFEAFECEGLLKENAENIAQGILRKFGKRNDDASCIVLKYLI